MRAIGNFLWFILGGVFMGLGWWLAGALAFVSIVGIPWGRACFVIGNFTFFPFGKRRSIGKTFRERKTSEREALALWETSSGFSWPAGGWLSGT